MPCIRDRNRCTSITVQNKRCKNRAVISTDFCCIHLPKECSICISDIKHRHSITLACKHHFHYGCIKQWVHTPVSTSRHTCPLCRAPISIRLLESIYPDYIDKVMMANFVFSQRLIVFDVEERHIQIVLPASPDQIECITDIIRMIKDALEEARDDLSDPPEDATDVNMFRGRNILFETSGSTIVNLRLPRTKRQLIALNALLDATIIAYDGALNEFEAARERFSSL